MAIGDVVSCAAGSRSNRSSRGTRHGVAYQDDHVHPLLGYEPADRRGIEVAPHGSARHPQSTQETPRRREYTEGMSSAIDRLR